MAADGPVAMLRWLKSQRDEFPIAKETPLSSLRFVVLDTELTSLDQRTNRLLSVGAIAMSGTKILLGEQFYRLVNPGVNVPDEGVLIHKLRPADIAAAGKPADVLAELEKFIRDSVLVGHFAEIDMKILRKELASTGQVLKNPAVCTARVHRWIVQNQRYSEDQFRKMETLDLASLAKVYKVDVHEAHHALDDAFVTARLWQKLLPALETKGIMTFGQLMKIGRI
jgi:DNA polymerase-3 subunit epsilon